jgi:hypothetical protein
MAMKTVYFENKITHEKYVCDNIKFARHLDGVEFVPVRKLNEPRQFLMRRDSLDEISKPSESLPG